MPTALSAPATPVPTGQAPYALGLVWLRRDLRLDDHAALARAAALCQRVQPVFVFDTDILAPLARDDRRLAFIHATLCELHEAWRAHAGLPHSGLLVAHGEPVDVLARLARELGAQVVVCARDFEPSAIARDARAAQALAEVGVAFEAVLDHVVRDPFALHTQAGQPYTVYTPYARAWLASLQSTHLQTHNSRLPPERVAQVDDSACTAARLGVPSLAELGFAAAAQQRLRLPCGSSGAQTLIADFARRIGAYDQQRDWPARKGPSYLSAHLRFGTLSVRQALRLAQPLAQAGDGGAATWRGELIWREFYVSILARFAHVVGAAFRPAYDAIVWDDDAAAQQRWQAWQCGRTGYPLVDAAMRQLNQTGYMHNRLRMVASSFLVKDLGLDWRWGEAYFAAQLLDFDLAANNGGWQWVASSGCDAQPYFRIFNPLSQSEKFDPEGAFIRRYVPELAALPNAALHAPWLARPIDLQAAGLRLGVDYPRPIVDHAAARARTLLRYAVVKSAAAPRACSA